MSPLEFVAVGGGAVAGVWLRWWLGLLFNPQFPTYALPPVEFGVIEGKD